MISEIYADESQTEELLNIKTPQFFEFGAVFDVVDSHRGEAIGAIQRKGFKSLIRDEWHLLSNTGQEIGQVIEANESAFMSRFLSNWIQQYYNIIAWDGRKLAEIQQIFNPFILKYTVRILDPEPTIDRRLLVVAGLLVAGVEGRQEEIFSVGGLGAGGALMGGSQGDDNLNVSNTRGSGVDADDPAVSGDVFDIGSSLFDDKD
jgi:hypothetical protein